MPAATASTTDGSFPFSVWLNIGTDDVVTVVVVKAEMGQGITTAFAMIVAEELDADWRLVRVQMAPEIDKRVMPGWHSTYGSHSVEYDYELLRKAGAAAREALMSAAANRWTVSIDQLTTASGAVYHADHGSVSYGELAQAASQLQLSPDPRLKSPGEFKIIGRDIPKLDLNDQIEGKPIFGIDVEVPDMVYASLRQTPVFGGRLENFADLDAKAAGADQLVEVDRGLAAVAKSWWTAERALERLDLTWSVPTRIAELDDAKISASLDEALERPGRTWEKQGDAPGVLESAPDTLSMKFEVPYLAHACLEPLNCTAHVTKNRCDIWAPTQYPEGIWVEA